MKFATAPSWKQRRLLLVAKSSLLGVFLWGTNQGLHERIQSIGWQIGLLVFAFVWALCVGAVLLVAFSPSKRTRLFWSVLIVTASVLGFAYRGITARFLGYSEFERLLGLVSFLDGVVGFYSEVIAQAVAWGVVGFVGINMPPFALVNGGQRRIRMAFASTIIPVQALSVAAIVTIVYARGGEGTDGFPVQYNGLAFLTVFSIESVARGTPSARQDVRISPSGFRRLRNVVLVMDESVRGDLLDVNSARGVETGLLRAGSSVINFGIASSIANCSEATNVSVRMGVTKQNYLKEMISNPSIWAYARKAGFRTAYLDGQRHGGRLQNHMNVDELALIDEFVQLDAKTPLYLRDIHLAQRLRAMLEAKQEPLFAIVNKMGAHFPYEGKYPSDSAKYQPTMAASYFGTEVDPRDVRSDLREDSENRRRYKNSYLNAIRWNTLQFFDALLPGLNLDETVIIYTSDHGQDFHEDGRPGYGTHCTDGPAVSEEGIVPLVFLTNERELLRRLRPAAESNANRASQFNLFPTLLSLMGYEDRDLTVESGFEPSLFTKLPDGNRRFLSTFYVRWGKAPVWNAIRGASQD